jgi:hypothetical protein
MASLKDTALTAVEAIRRVIGDSTSTKAKTFLDAVVAEEREHIYARRQAAADERTSLFAKQTERAKAYAPRRAAGLALVDRKQAEVDAAIAEYQHMEAEERSAMFELERLHGRVSGELAITASPRIDDFARTLRDEIAATFRRYDTVSESRLSGAEVQVWNNKTSVDRRTAALRQAIETVKALAFEPIDDAAVEARLERIWTALPAVEGRPAKYLVNPEAVGAA